MAQQTPPESKPALRQAFWGNDARSWPPGWSRARGLDIARIIHEHLDFWLADVA